MGPQVTLDVSLTGCEPGDHVPLPSSERDHLEKVLRLEPGAPLVVADGAGQSAAARLAGETAELSTEVRFEPRARPSLTVLHALPKGRKLDEVVRLLTELGVDRMIPVESEHSVVQLSGRRAERAAVRWQAIATSATNQSRRAWCCQVERPRPLAEALGERGTAAGVVAVVGADGGVGDAVGRSAGDVDELILAVGPEGGWHPDEVEALQDWGLVPVGLGPNVLRTEHAAGVLTAVVSYVLGRLD